MRAPIIIALLVIGGLPDAAATPAVAPAPSGWYEDVAPHLGIPAGRLAKADAALLPAWLDVRTEGRVSALTVMPDRRVHLELTYGDHGLARKVVTVDGEVLTDSAFTYDAAGRLAQKVVSGPGASDEGANVTFDYRVDRSGRVVERRSSLPADPLIRYVYKGRRVTRDAVVDGVVVRRARFDAHGRRVETSWFGADRARLDLRYRRRADGSLRRIERRRRGQPVERARWDRPIKGLTSTDLALVPTLTPRHEVLLALGAPVRHSDSETGVGRRIEDDFSDGCWLNKRDQLVYDAAGTFQRGNASCICGLCVDARHDVVADAIDGWDLHWTAGPWVRLDGVVDVTADHHVMTPDGPRAAGTLAVGDAVLNASGEAHVLRAVTRLPPGDPRWGVNVRTAAGTFAAGGLLFESEALAGCAAGEPRGHQAAGHVAVTGGPAYRAPRR